VLEGWTRMLENTTFLLLRRCANVFDLQLFSLFLLILNRYRIRITLWIFFMSLLDFWQNFLVFLILAHFANYAAKRVPNGSK
jgi:hypothetical protein